MNVLTIATGANSEPQPSGLTLPVMALALARDFRRSDVNERATTNFRFATIIMLFKRTRTRLTRSKENPSYDPELAATL